MPMPSRWTLPLLLSLLLQTATELAVRIDASSVGGDGGARPCLHAIATAPLADASAALSSYGILFTVTSPPSLEEVTVSSLGFYVDAAKLRSTSGDVTYEVRTLAGHYADPERTNGGNGGLPLDASWESRGDAERWDTIAEGLIDAGDLAVWPPGEGGRAADYFRIPFDEFRSISIEGEEVRSFYVTLREVGALRYAPLDGWEGLHDAQNVRHCGDARVGISSGGAADDDEFADCVPGNYVDGKPVIRIGEGVVAYPFPSMGHFYRPRRFMGGMYYRGECLTGAPSASPSSTAGPSASRAPTLSPTVVETSTPSRSHRPSPVPKTLSPTTEMGYVDAGSDGCHAVVTTDRKYERVMDHNSFSASYGIVFPIKSRRDDGDGLWITSFGFHVDFAAMPPSLDGSRAYAVDYEVYALAEEGLYADSKRGPGGRPKKFDHRGNFSLWDAVSAGTIHEGDLTSNAGDYFQIPWSDFEPTFVPANGGKRSFYLTLTGPAFVYKRLNNDNLGSLHEDDDYNKHRDQTPEPPLLVYGEGVIGYPFRSVPFLYSPKQFIGRVFYEYTCPSLSPSEAPSLEPIQSPSQPPSSQPSSMPSSNPTASREPTRLPTDSPSASRSPSVAPSGGPTASSRPSWLHFPSVSPSASLPPSEGPSSRPTASRMPSASSMPSSPPSLAPSSPAPRVSHSLLGVTSLGALFLTWLLRLSIC